MSIYEVPGLEQSAQNTEKKDGIAGPKEPRREVTLEGRTGGQDSDVPGWGCTELEGLGDNQVAMSEGH